MCPSVIILLHFHYICFLFVDSTWDSNNRPFPSQYTVEMRECAPKTEFCAPRGLRAAVSFVIQKGVIHTSRPSW